MLSRAGGRVARETPGFFAPQRFEGRYLGFGGRVTRRRLLVRLAVFLLALAALDHAIAPLQTPGAVFRTHYRLPRTMPTSDLADYADAIDASARDSGGSSAAPVVIFLGASPTWGHRISDPGNAFPYAFALAAASSGVGVRAFDLASNGQFVGDYYVIARRLLGDADAVYVQMTYQTFNPAARGSAAMRYPELARLLGVRLSAEEARILRLPASASSPLALADSMLGRHWSLWRERDALDRRLFGARPRTAVERAALRASGDDVTFDDEVTDDGFGAFDTLEPEQQLVVVAAYAQDSSFQLRASDGEVERLRRLAKLLADAGVPAVFYMAPLNRGLIDENRLIDPAQYARNVAVLRAAVESNGLSFRDYNSGPLRIPRTQFADVSHTTDAGGRAFGAMLWEDTSATVPAVSR